MTQNNTLLSFLFKRVDIASLIFFRIAFGIVMLWEVKRYFDKGWIARYWIDPLFNFAYTGFEWLSPWSGNGMYLHFYGLGLLALFISLGLFYRLSMALFFVAFSYIFLLEEARYLNHFYLIMLLSFVMIFVPAHRSFSLDALLRPGLRADTVPAWTLWLVRFQLGVAYFFGGIAKLNSDWLLRGEPLRDWLSDRTDFPFIGQFFDYEWAVYLFAYGGLLIDLLAVPLLLWRRTRPYAFTAVVLFNLLNASWFSIGIFPWLMIVASSILFAPSWPRKLFDTLWLRPSHKSVLMMAGALLGTVGALWFHRTFELVPLTVGALAGLLISWFFMDKARPLSESSQFEISYKYSKNITRSQFAVVILLSSWALVQIGLPLRHYTVPSKVSWTEEGHRFAWHMKLRDKDGEVQFYAVNPHTQDSREIDPRATLTSWQYRKMSTRPYMIRQFARYLASKPENLEAEIRVRALAELNDREPQFLIDPNVDLAKVDTKLLGRNDWILDLNETQYASLEP